jgi:hypothetical protein
MNKEYDNNNNLLLPLGHISNSFGPCTSIAIMMYFRFMQNEGGKL